MLSGILNINKPADQLSRKEVDEVCRLLRTSRVGHAGTLDPLASGVLVVAVGLGTRLISYMQEQPKEYQAEFLLGQRSDTDDITGELSFDLSGVVPSRAEIEALLPQFTGRIRQVPPDFSAIHVDGRRAYHLARKGVEFEIPAREVEVHELKILGYDYPRLSLDMTCGSGTYVRSLGRDLGDLLGCGAVMSNLVRTRVGSFRLENAIVLDQLTRATAPAALLPLAAAVSHLPHYTCTADEVVNARNGKVVPLPEPTDAYGPATALLGPAGELIAIAEYHAIRGGLQPRLVIRER